MLTSSAVGFAQKKVNVDSVMNRVYHYIERNQLVNDGFTSDVYVQHYLHTRRKGVLMRYMPGAIKLERGENRYFGESFSEYKFLPPAQVHKKDIAVYNTMPYVTEPRDYWIGRYSMSVYEPNFFTDRILSPFNILNQRFYKYKLLSTYQNTGRLIARIQITPRIWNSQLVRGNADIDVFSGKVNLFSFQFFYGWSRLYVEGEMGPEGKASLLPRRVTLSSRMKLFGNLLEEQFDARAQYDFDSPVDIFGEEDNRGRDKYDLTTQSRLRIDTSKVVRTLDFFEKKRPVHLMSFQQDIYDYAALRQKQKREEKKNEKVKPAREMAENIILDSHTITLGKNGKVRFPPLITPSMVEWSKSDGFSLRTRLAFNFELKKKQNLEFGPRVGYNFKQNQVYWRCPLSFTFKPKYDAYARLEVAGGEHVYNSRQADDVRKRMQGITHYDTIMKIFNSYNFHYYRDNRFNLEVGFLPYPGLSLSSGLRFHHRSLINWNELSSATSMRRSLVSLAPSLHLEWTPRLYYYRVKERPVPLHSMYPTFMIDYERGLRLNRDEMQYERIEMNVSYRKSLHALRSVYLRMGGGLYTLRGDNTFLDYENFRKNYMYSLSNDDFIGQFQLLDNRWYNESNYYFRLSTAYESPMLLFSRIKYLTRIVEKEFLYCHFLNVRSLDLYTEFGYGISFPLLRVAAFGALAGKGQSAFGCKVAIHLGDFY